MYLCPVKSYISERTEEFMCESSANSQLLPLPHKGWVNSYLVVFTMALLWLPLTGAGQDFVHSGTKFYLPSGYPFEFSGNEISIRIYSEVENCVSLTIPTTGQAYHFSIDSGATLDIRLDTLFSIFRGVDGLLPDSLQRGYLLQAPYAMSVVVRQNSLHIQQSDATANQILPVDQIGHEYLLFEKKTEDTLDYDSFNYSLSSVNNNTLHLSFPAETEKFKGDTSYVVGKAPYEIIVDTALNQTNERIEGGFLTDSNQASFSWYFQSLGYVLPGCFERYPFPPLGWLDVGAVSAGFIPSVNEAGKTFLISSLKYKLGFKVRAMSTEDNNVLYVNGAIADTLQRAEIWETCSMPTPEAIVEGTKPLLVSTHGEGTYHVDSTYQHRPTGLMAYYVPHTGQMIAHGHFKAEAMRYADTFFVNLQCRTADTALFTHNGQAWQNLGFRPFSADPSYSYARVNIKAGEHDIKNPEGFIGVHYAMNLGLPNNLSIISSEKRFEDYAYPLGGIAPADTAKSTFRYSTDGAGFVPFDSIGPTLCEGAPLYLLPADAHQLQWEWDFGNGSQTTQQVGEERADTLMITYSSPGPYQLSASQQQWACVANASLPVTVVPLDSLHFEVSLTQDCSGTSLQGTTATSGFNDYEWSIDGEVIEEGPSFRFDLGQVSKKEVMVTLKASNQYCEDSLSRPVALAGFNPKLAFPNVFTPNGDGINDCFKIGNAGYLKACFELSVYNRWGQRLYQSIDPTECWEAQNIAAGVYYYLLSTGAEEYRGWFTLAR